LEPDYKSKNIEDLDLTTWKNWETIDCKLASPNTFALPCRKSMETRFPQGTVFFVNTIEQPRDGDLVVVKFESEETASLRELLVDPPSWQLKPISPNTPGALFDKNKHIILGVIMLTRLVGERL
jgi:Peptidase S24-like.